MPQIQDRIIDLRRLPPGDLHPHPENWRTHGSDQTEGMAAMLEDVGMATAVVAYEDEEWGLTLICAPVWTPMWCPCWCLM